jgi:hypothetical protein
MELIVSLRTLGLMLSISLPLLGAPFVGHAEGTGEQQTRNTATSYDSRQQSENREKARDTSVAPGTRQCGVNYNCSRE